MDNPVLPFVWSLFFAIGVVYSQYQCYNAYSCAYDSSISYSTTTILCYGDHSSTGSSITTTSTGYIYCYGSYSCYQATQVRHTSDSYTRSIHCYGLSACASVAYLYNNHGALYCHGELSCSESTIIAESDNSMYCDGVRSCYGADIQVAYIIYLRGLLAAQDATITAYDTAATFYFYGHESGNGATIECLDTCAIYCYGTGCNGLMLNCQDSGCVFSVTCYDGAENSDVCSYGYEIPESLRIPSFTDVEFSTYENSHYACNTSLTGAIHCDDYQGCYNGGSKSNNGSICCSGYQSCNYIPNLTTAPNVSNVNVAEIAYRADGYASANSMSGTIDASKNGGNMYFSGRDANSDASDSYETTIKNNGKWDIFSMGHDATRYKIITSARNLHCGGHSLANIQQYHGLMIQFMAQGIDPCTAQ